MVGGQPIRAGEHRPCSRCAMSIHPTHLLRDDIAVPVEIALGLGW